MSVVTDPDGFYETVELDFIVRRSFAVVALAGVASALPNLVVLYYQLQTEPGSATSLLLIGGALTVVSSLLSVFAFWLIYAGIIHVSAMVMTDGSALSVPEGTFRRLCLLVAWGFVADAIVGLNRTLTTFLTLRQTFSSASLSELNAAVMSASLQNSPAMRMMVGVTVLILIWRWFIWTFAVKHTYETGLRRSVAIAAIPSVISILLTVFVFNADLLGL